jgi:putative CocE/NonD family hydrolase
MAQGVQAQRDEQASAVERTGKLPRHVRFFLRHSRKGLPAPLHEVRVERGLQIPMPDGTRQLADRYSPVGGGPYPTLLVRTPYGRGFPYDYVYGALFAEQGFHVVIASCRGTAGSTGAFEPFVAEAADARATVGWLREQPWFNGSLGTIGASYLGFTQWALAADPPPELKAMVIQVSGDDFSGFLYPGGAFALEATLTGVASMISQEQGFRATAAALIRLLLTYKKVERAYPLLRRYQPAFGRQVSYFEDWLKHPAPDDPYWAPRRANPDISAAPPVSLLGGWSDILLDQTLDSYQRLRAAGRKARLIVGPWNHTSGFNKDMPVVAGEALGWLRFHLTGDGEFPGPEPVRLHVGHTGKHPGEWRDLPDWPPPDAAPRMWHLRADGTLADEPGEGTLSFRYDPADPTPSVGGPRMDGNGHGPRPNNTLEARDDVLVYTGEPLARPLDAMGPVSIRLRVKGSSPHFDIFVPIMDTG